MHDDATHWARGKRILVTRPREQARSLVALLAQLGATPLELPVLEIEPLPDAQIERDKIINLDQFDAIILVSVNAARCALDWIGRYWPQLPLHLEWYAVGDATARLLDAAGIVATTPAGAANSEGLLRLPGLLQQANKKVLIVKGAGGRTLLQDELTRRGAQVESLALYRRCLPDYSVAAIEQVWGGEPPDALLATSVDALNNLEQLLLRTGNEHYGVPLVVASERIARVARDKGYSHVVAAQGATDDCILQALNVIG